MSVFLRSLEKKFLNTFFTLPWKCPSALTRSRCNAVVLCSSGPRQAARLWLCRLQFCVFHSARTQRGTLHCALLGWVPTRFLLSLSFSLQGRCLLFAGSLCSPKGNVYRSLFVCSLSPKACLSLYHPNSNVFLFNLSPSKGNVSPSLPPKAMSPPLWTQRHASRSLPPQRQCVFHTQLFIGLSSGLGFTFPPMLSYHI